MTMNSRAAVEGDGTELLRAMWAAVTRPRAGEKGGEYG